MRLARTRFARDIVAEYYKPAKDSTKVIIFCGGMPSMPTNQRVIEFYGKKGYWVFYPRYRGTWESDGKFLKISPHQDLLDIIDQLPRGFADGFTGKKYKVKPSKIFLLGGSFGGPAMLLASRDKRVTKAVLRSPVVDWLAPSRDEKWDKKFERWVNDSFGSAYRYDQKDFYKIPTGRFYNPMPLADEIDGSKLIIMHAKDDYIVHYGPVKKFAAKTGARLITFKKGGHLSADLFMKPRFEKIIKNFFK